MRQFHIVNLTKTVPVCSDVRDMYRSELVDSLRTQRYVPENLYGAIA